MKRVLITIAALMLPLVAWAQDGVPPSGAADEGVIMPAAGGANQRTAPAPAIAPTARRRPSMVGYIDDSTIQTQVRIRFDAAYDLDSPDRAEFFYGKCGCFRTLPTNNPAYDPKAPGPGPGVLTSLNFQELFLHAEYAPTARLSIVGELPFRFLQPQTFVAGTGSFGNQSGVSDLRFGAKYALFSDESRQVTASFQFWAPSGDASKGLGTNHWAFEPELLYFEHPTDRLGIEAQFGFVRPKNGSAGVPANGPSEFWGSVLYYGIGPSYEIYRSRATSFAPVLELVGWRVLGGQQTNGPTDATGTNIVNLKLGGRLQFGRGSSVYAGYGHALTSATWYDNMFRLEYRVSF